MRFSEIFEIDVDEGVEWFDPILTLDTKLFVDPFLIYDNEKDEFQGSHDEVIEYFNYAFQLLAQSAGDKGSKEWSRALTLLMFPEVAELCLGYTGRGTSGLGSGRDVATRIAGGMWTAILQGVNELRHFEEVQIFDSGIGPDRISDATAGVLKDRLARYTIRICDQYGIPTAPHVYTRALFDFKKNRWVSREYTLPTNPNNRKPILLVPKRYLRPLPTINPQDFWDYCHDNHTDLLRQQFGDDISRSVKKEIIVKFAREHPALRMGYVTRKEALGTEPYDFPNDPSGFVKWYSQTKNWVQTNPRPLAFSTKSEFEDFITALIEQFRVFVQDNGGWSLLWNENETPKREEASQLLFIGIVSHYCRANEVDISREANIGRGPVDFKLSSGYSCRALIEVKLAKNTKFWRGLERQLPKYLQAEQISDGRFLVIIFNERDWERVSDIERRTRQLNAQTNYNIESELVDAGREPPSASRL